jgi:ribonuclease-3
MLELLKNLGIEIISKGEEGVFLEAFTHRSAVNEKSKLNVHNERLEFLGDAVLEMITTEFLYYKFAEKAEGEMTNLRAALVCGEHLAEIAKKLGLGEFLVMSRGEAKSGGAKKSYLLANVTEAMIGAIYVNYGIKKSREFITKYILCDLEAIMKSASYIDAKSEFQEIAQGEMSITPHYEVLAESGKDHEKSFEVAAFLKDKMVGKGVGGSKKEAQTDAAKDALEHQKVWRK